MLNFKKVLLGDCQNLDVREQTQWPELGSVSKGNVSQQWRNFGNNQQRSEEVNDSITNAQNNYFKNNNMPNPSSSKVLPSSSDFPKLSESLQWHSEKRKRMCSNSFSEEPTNSKQCDIKLPKQNIPNSKYKKPKKSLSKAPISIDISVMLKISLSLAERKRMKKRLPHSRKPLSSKHDLLTGKNPLCGNKLDSDCPVRHKGKKRPHKRRKNSPVKRSFLLAAEKLNENDNSNNSNCLKRMHRLKQIILAKIAAKQDIDDLVTNLGRIGLRDNEDNIQPEIAPSAKFDHLHTAKLLLHTKNFRQYCDHTISASIKTKACELITKLRNFQDKTHIRDPINSLAKRRYVCGCHESRKFLRAGSVKLLFIANNLSTENGVPTILQELFNLAQEANIPIIFAGSAKDLGYWTLKTRKTSALALLNYEGAEQLFTDLLNELSIAKKNYQDLIEKIKENLKKVEPTDLEKESLEKVEQQIRENIISKLT